MKKLFLIALCSTSLLSFARAEDGMGSGDAMQHEDAMKPESTPAPRTAAQQPKKRAKKQHADGRTKQGGMDHGSMQHDGMDAGSTQHDGQMDGGTK